jgi:hypothetical protein
VDGSDSGSYPVALTHEGQRLLPSFRFRSVRLTASPTVQNIWEP